MNVPKGLSLRRSSQAVGYGVAIASVVVATALRWVLNPMLGESVPFITFYLAVVVAASYGGFRSAVLAALLSLLVVGYIFISPHFTFQADRRADIASLVVFFVVSLAVAALGGAMRTAEQHAREQSELLRITLTSIGDAVLRTDACGNVMFLNPMAQQLTGWTQDEAAGKPIESILRLINEHTRHPAENPVEKVLKLGQVVGLANSTLLVSRDGTERPIDDSAAPVRDDRRHVSGVVMVFRDITERRRAEASSRRLAAIVESSSDAIISKDLHSVVNTWNEAAERLFGYTSEEMIGRPVTVLIPEDHADEEPAILQRIARGERVDHYETVRRRKDGSLLPISLTVSPIFDAAGRVIGASKIARDITERKQLEEQLRQRMADLTESDRRKDEFLATLAHELRNPLAPVSNALQVMRMARGDGELVERSRQIIERQQQQLVRMVDDLLDVARITRGLIELRKEHLEVATIVESAVESTRPFIDSFGHALIVTKPEQPVWLDADPVRLAQVVANLLNNSAKYTPPRGQIHLVAEKQDGEALFRVRDNGIGIPADMLPKVYDMFTQVDAARDRAHGGLGIGLMLVKTLVELHGGRVEAHSAGPGLGSEFVVRLPLATVQHAPPPAPDHAPVSPPARRVLVVDDNKDVADTLAMLLRLMGHEIQTADDGPAALELARVFRPHAVLLDVGLPEMNGHEVARRLRAQPELVDVLLVALTGWGQQDDRRRSQEAGFDYHLTKPASLAELECVLAAIKIAG